MSAPDTVAQNGNTPDAPELRAEVEKLRAEVSELRSPTVRVLSEPLTYGAHIVRDPRGPRGFRAISHGEPRSYVKDFVQWNKRGDRAAQERLERHGREMRVLAGQRERLLAPGASYELEQRTVNWATGTGGYSAPPAWIIDQFAVVPTPPRVLSAHAPQFDLPVGCQSVNLPRWTAGAEVGESQVGGSDTSTDIADSIVSSAVATIAGNEDVPLQMLEQSPVGAHLDWAVFSNMEARYGYQLELQLLTGTGVSGAEATRSGNNQLLGILNNTAIPSANKITYTDATPTAAKMVGPQATQAAGGAIPQAVAAIGNNRKMTPEYWMMTTSRAAWIGSQEVSMFPLAVANQSGPGEFDLLAYPVAANDAIPTNLGAAANQDTIICCRPSDWLILESDRHVQLMPDVLSGTLMVRLQLRRYVAALLRQPTSVAYITGTGMVVQSQLGF